MNENNYINEDIESTLKDIASFKEQIRKFPELDEIGPALRDLEEGRDISDEIYAFQERAELLIHRIVDILNKLRVKEFDFDTGSAIRVSSLANELQSQLEWLNSLLMKITEISEREDSPGWFKTQCVAPTKRAIDKIKKYLTPLLKKVLSKLWQIISSLLTPKEWKLQGKVGTGILGLADVGIEITFGK